MNGARSLPPTSNTRLLCRGGFAAALPCRRLLCPFSLGFCLCLLLSPTMHTRCPLLASEHGLQLEPCASCSRTCCLHQVLQGRTWVSCVYLYVYVQPPASRRGALPHIWTSPECSGFTMCGCICLWLSAVVAFLSPWCHCSPACMGCSLAYFFVGAVGVGTASRDIDGKPSKREDLALTLSRCEI